MKQLIVTADDYGAHPYIDAGIKKAVYEKNVNTISCLVTFDRAENSIRAFMKECRKNNQEVNFGLHISLTAGTPVLKNEARSLTSDGEHFMDIDYYDYDKTKPGEVYNEVEAQILKLKKICEEEGFPIDHLTSHHGIMGLFPDYLKIYLQLAAKHNIPVRNPILISQLRMWGFMFSRMKREGLYRGLKILRNKGGNQVAITLLTMKVKNLKEILYKFNGGVVRFPSYFIDTFYKKANEKRLRKILRHLPNCSNELVVHLGEGTFSINDEEIKKYNGINLKYFDTRHNELVTICKVDINKYLTSRKAYSWFGYKELQEINQG